MFSCFFITKNMSWWYDSSTTHTHMFFWGVTSESFNMVIYCVYLCSLSKPRTSLQLNWTPPFLSPKMTTWQRTGWWQYNTTQQIKSRGHGKEILLTLGTSVHWLALWDLFAGTRIWTLVTLSSEQSCFVVDKSFRDHSVIYTFLFSIIFNQNIHFCKFVL